ncbi:hypothetical protein EXW96_20830 [Paenibacillus sp. JMULE4]|uniref:hypothetical protein n=1 Tax=Paenibacillus sp. JMULE4 TaxID=2518342 RepID=UPI001575D450|nr:hypothetical protein [Paenibacillus sp. JMULE4]NTZ19902.1 hypothetical protein [Paenibacillus sp. JMULE4]
MNAVSREHSRHAVWLAVNSEYGDRLTEITREHVALAKSLIMDRESLSDSDRGIYSARIVQLRQERDAIIQQFEEK